MYKLIQITPTDDKLGQILEILENTRSEVDRCDSHTPNKNSLKARGFEAIYALFPELGVLY